jgi:HEAT repeat protein
MLFAVGLAISPVLASVAPAVLGQQRVDSPPTDDEFKEQIKRLQPKNSVPARSEAVKWLERHAEAKNAPLAIPALERCIRADPETKVREAAVECLALIAQKQQVPCPLSIVEAMLDKEEFVSQAAVALADQFKRFAPGSVKVLLRCARSDNPRLRGNCLTTLARAGGKDREVLEALEKAKQDKSFGIHHNAHCALFQANDNLEEFLTYLIRLQEDPEGVLGQVDTNSETGKQEMTTQNLVRISAALLVIGWSDQRADDLAPALLKLLRSPSPILRRGAPGWSVRRDSRLDGLDTGESRPEETARPGARGG